MSDKRAARRSPDLSEALAALLEDPTAAPRPELAPAAELVAALRATGAALEARTSLPAQTRAAQRQRLLAVAHVQAQAEQSEQAEPAAAARPGLLARLTGAAPAFASTRRAVALAGGMASFIAVAGVGVAATQSLPGDPFYDVKRTTEAVQLRFAGSDEARGELHLAIARTRLREVDGLVNGRDALTALGSVATSPSGLGALSSSTAERVLDTLEDMDEQTQDGVEVLTQVSRETQSAGPLEAVARFADQQSAQLGALLPSLPTEARSQASASLALVQEVKSESEELLEAGFCTVDCDPVRALPTPQAPSGAPRPAPSATTSEAPCACAPDPDPSEEPAPTEPTATPSPAPTEPAPTPSRPVPSVPVPTTPPAVPTVPVVPTLPPVTVPPLLPLPLPTEIPLPLPQLPGLPLPTSIPLPPLPLPSLPGLPPLLGQ